MAKITLMQEEGKKQIAIRADEQILHLIKKLKLNDETFIIKLNGKIAHEQTPLKDGDNLEFVNVIYGG